MLVLRTGVAELHYLDEDGTVVGDPVDVFMVQDQIPTSPGDVKIFFQKDSITKKQVGGSKNQYFGSGVMHGEDFCMGRTPPNVLTILTHVRHKKQY